MQGPIARYLDGGERLHLQHGPIDLIVGADAVTSSARFEAFEAATQRFDGILSGLVSELSALRSPVQAETPDLFDTVAQRMLYATRPLCDAHFLTPMIAVAGSVADEVLDAMRAAVSLRRAYVNNGGDIALFLTKGSEFSLAMAGHGGSDLGRIHIHDDQGVGGVATSGTKGRSLSFGIADSVTVLAKSAAAADVAATLVANAVDLPGHPGVRRQPACELDPDSDLGVREVVTFVPALTSAEIYSALRRGQLMARRLYAQGLILGAALFLQGEVAIEGQTIMNRSKNMELKYA